MFEHRDPFRNLCVANSITGARPAFPETGQGARRTGTRNVQSPIVLIGLIAGLSRIQQGDREMAEAWWNGTRIAHSDDTVIVEGNHYFPRTAVDPAALLESATTSVCPWKGTAHYYSIEAGGSRNPDAAWYYPEPKEAASQIKDRIAFWKGVEVR
jgi:uncharacterized protein (DUF427 family)